MGNLVTALGKRALGKARRFNIENRTDKFLEKNVKIVSPKPLATQLEIEKLNRENPNLMEEINKPYPQLLDRLKDVYVTSTDPPTDAAEKSSNPTKPLPVERSIERELYGYVEPTSVTPGRISLRKAVALLSQYKADKEVNNVASLAFQYNLKEEDVGFIVENFKLFTYMETGETSNMPGVELYNPDADKADKFNVRSAPKFLKMVNETLESDMAKERRKKESNVAERDEKVVDLDDIVKKGNGDKK